MRVFVTGGTGFVGRHVVAALLEAGHRVDVLVRPGSPRAGGLPEGAEVVEGDLLDGGLAELLPPVDAIVHLVGIIRESPRRGVTYERFHVEATRNVVEAARARGVRRLVHMSAQGAAADGPTGYFRSKARAEEIVAGSGLDFTIFRPAVIFGAGDSFVGMLGGQVRGLPVVPVIGDGGYRLQPVSVADVARGFVEALDRPETVGETYCVSGPETFSYDELLDAVARGLGKERARKAHLPLGLMRPVIRALEKLPFFPITTDQLTMLLASNRCEPEPFFEAFGFEPTRFSEGLRERLAT